MQRLCLSRGILSIAIVIALAALVAGQEEKRDGSYGFDGKKIFKFNRGVGPIALADLDRDARTDIVVFDAYRAELVFLFQDPEGKGKTQGSGPNSLADPDGFRRATIPLARKVDTLVIQDLDEDGRPDLLLGGSGAVEVRWGSDDLRFQQNSSYRLRDAVSGQAATAQEETEEGAAVYFLAKKGIHRFRGFSRDKSPERTFFPGSASTPKAMYLTDMDGDGRKDLLTLLEEKSLPFRLRLRRPDGGFGPEYALEAERPAAVRVVEDPEGSQVISLTLGKGRFEVLGLTQTAAQDPFDLPPPEVFPLDSAGLESPRLLTADLDGDGDIDVAVNHRTQNQVLLFLNQGGELVPSAPSPTLRKVVALHDSDLDGDGRPEVLVTSTDEKVIGASSVESGTLRFPSVLEGIEAPLLAAAADFGAGPELVVVTRAPDGVRLGIYTRTDDGAWAVKGDEWSILLDGVTGDPPDVMVGGGLVILFVPFQAPRLHRVTPTGLEAISAPGVLEKSSRGGVSFARNGDLLVASGNHCRRIRIGSGKPEVVYQVNGPRGSSTVVCALEARLSADAPPSLLIVDRTDRSISVYGGSGPQPERKRTISGPYHQVTQGAVVDLNGDGSDEVILLDPKFLAVVRADGRRPRLRSHFTYQSPDERTRYITGATGDLNGSGEDDLILSDGSLRKLHVLRPGPRFQWVHALRFPVYEAKSFSGRSGGMEPRGVSVADLNSDGLQDVLILVHDRLILYPQEAPPG